MIFGILWARLYEKKWNSTFVEAEHDENSNQMHHHQKIDSVIIITYKIWSFGPDTYSKYFQISCNSLLVNSTDSSKTFETTTKSETNVNADFEPSQLVYIYEIKWMQSFINLAYE